jgi:hypothetical protein
MEMVSWCLSTTGHFALMRKKSSFRRSLLPVILMAGVVSNNTTEVIKIVTQVTDFTEG